MNSRLPAIWNAFHSFEYSCDKLEHSHFNSFIAYSECSAHTNFSWVVLWTYDNLLLRSQKPHCNKHVKNMFTNKTKQNLTSLPFSISFYRFLNPYGWTYSSEVNMGNHSRPKEMLGMDKTYWSGKEQFTIFPCWSKFGCGSVVSPKLVLNQKFIGFWEYAV